MLYQPIPGVTLEVTFNAEQVASHLAYHFEQFLLNLFQWLWLLPGRIKLVIGATLKVAWQKVVLFTQPGRQDLQLLWQVAVDNVVYHYKHHVASPCARYTQAVREGYQRLVVRCYEFCAAPLQMQ